MDIEYKGIALIPVITMVVDIFKKAGLPTKFAPLVSLGIGVGFGIVFHAQGDIREGILEGILMGTSASGIYSNGKEMMKHIQERKNGK